MLVEMDGFAKDSGIIILAATNRPDALDPALRRPGRFDRELQFCAPDETQRRAILALHTESWAPSSKPTLRITGIPAFQDNYLWLIDDGEHAVAVDPGDAQPVLDELNKRNLTLTSILVTHHHADHIGGIDALLKHYSVPVIGPADSRIPQLTQRVADGDTYTLLGQTAQVIEVPGHTLHHIAYFITQQLFCFVTRRYGNAI